MRRGADKRVGDTDKDKGKGGHRQGRGTQTREGDTDKGGGHRQGRGTQTKGKGGYRG